WWENADGQGGTWTRHTIATDMYQPCSEWAADMDADLDIDIVAASTSARMLCWWQNADGRGVRWIEHFTGADIYTPWEVISADLDGDGNHEFPLGLEHSIRIYSAVGPSTNGWMDSSILSLGCDPSWDCISWTASVPFDASLGIQVRASDNPGDMGEWSSMLTEPGSLVGLLGDGYSYLQYRLVMTAGPSGLLPALHGISFAFDVLGTGEGGDPPRDFGMVERTTRSQGPSS
ncbi:VCBS repeat-containing protein, partial [Candidatus Fermentibacteria bacterium]|nr:VCBS repeat-containing protein [Candidatus Fermentibacteria bacterium]